MLYKYYGPPGTGKTYRLISRAKAYVRKYKIPLDRIGYFAFTKKAADEAKTRMPFENKKLRYFKTLHALAFECIKIKDDLKMTQEDVMQPYHYEELGKELNLQVKFYDRYNKDESFYLGFENPYFQIIQRAFNKCIDLKEEFNLEEYDPKDVNWITLDHINKNLLNYKKVKNKYEFNDMIKLLIDQPENIPEFDVIFIDEAQDLSPLQWKLFDVLKTKTKDMYLAGDDDQAIFAWAGADVSRFIKEPAKEKTLIYSKRISKTVQEQSKIAIGNISGVKKNKIYHPRDYEGVCEEIYNLDEIDLTKGKWLILARTISKILKIEEILIEKGLYYESTKRKSIKVSLYKAVKNYERWRKGEELTEQETNDIKGYIGNVKWNKNENWFDAFALVDKDEQEQKEYFVRLFENKEDLDKDARIWISTIHAIKGGEKDNVILCTDLGDKIVKSMNRSDDKADEEHRVWYVAYTRARNNLYTFKLANKTRRTYPI
jgi:DNA helicase-2/ATP-dependent DNA helicase PcrA